MSIDRHLSVRCSCDTEEHTFVFCYCDYGDGDIDLSMRVLLTHFRGFFKRLWVAVRYLFKAGKHDVHFDDVMININSAYDIMNFMKDYISDYEDRVDAARLKEVGEMRKNEGLDP